MVSGAQPMGVGNLRRQTQRPGQLNEVQVDSHSKPAHTAGPVGSLMVEEPRRKRARQSFITSVWKVADHRIIAKDLLLLLIDGRPS